MCVKTDKSVDKKQMFEIGKEVLDKTVQCGAKNCLCGHEIMCHVQNYVSDKIIFVNCDEHGKKCTYYLTFGAGDLCRCPTRIAIYKQYEK